jgi:hypothetical protein
MSERDPAMQGKNDIEGLLFKIDDLVNARVKDWWKQGPQFASFALGVTDTVLLLVCIFTGAVSLEGASGNLAAVALVLFALFIAIGLAFSFVESIFARIDVRDQKRSITAMASQVVQAYIEAKGNAVEASNINAVVRQSVLPLIGEDKTQSQKE